MKLRISLLCLFFALLSNSSYASKPHCDALGAIQKLTPKPKASPQKKLAALRKQYGEFHEISTADNAHFIALKDGPERKDLVYYTRNMGVLQELNNEIIGEKVTSDAIVNCDKTLTLKNLKSDVRFTHPEASYESYKGTEFAVKKTGPAGSTEAALIKQAKVTAQEFADKIESLGIQDRYQNRTDLSASPLKWPRAGVSKNSAAEANLYARLSKYSNLSSKEFQVGTEATEGPLAKKLLGEIYNQEKILSANPKLFGKVIVPTQTEGRNMLSVKTMYLLKNAKTKTEFAEVAQFVFKLENPLEAKEIDAIYRWHQTADLFGPDIYSDERISVHSLGGKDGIIAIDYRNLSGRKFQTIMEGIAASPAYDVKSVVKNVERFFSEDHDLLLAQHANIHEIIDEAFKKVNTKTSGDELVSVASHQMRPHHMHKMVLGVYEDPLQLEVRTAFLKIGDPAKRGAALHEAEEIEKSMRWKLTRKIDAEKIDRVHFSLARTELGKDELGNDLYRFKLFYTGNLDKDDITAVNATITELQDTYPALRTQRFVRRGFKVKTPSVKASSPP